MHYKKLHIAQRLQEYDNDQSFTRLSSESPCRFQTAIWDNVRWKTCFMCYHYYQLLLLLLMQMLMLVGGEVLSRIIRHGSCTQHHSSVSRRRRSHAADCAATGVVCGREKTGRRKKGRGNDGDRSSPGH